MLVSTRPSDTPKVSAKMLQEWEKSFESLMANPGARSRISGCWEIWCAVYTGNTSGCVLLLGV